MLTFRVFRASALRRSLRPSSSFFNPLFSGPGLFFLFVQLFSIFCGFWKCFVSMSHRRPIKHELQHKQSADMQLDPLRPYNDLSQTSHCNIKVLSVSEVMRIENMIIQVKFYLYVESFSPLFVKEIYGNIKGEIVF